MYDLRRSLARVITLKVTNIQTEWMYVSVVGYLSHSPRCNFCSVKLAFKTKMNRTKLRHYCFAYFSLQRNVFALPPPPSRWSCHWLQQKARTATEQKPAQVFTEWMWGRGWKEPNLPIHHESNVLPSAFRCIPAALTKTLFSYLFFALSAESTKVFLHFHHSSCHLSSFVRRLLLPDKWKCCRIVRMATADINVAVSEYRSFRNGSHYQLLWYL